MVAAATRTALAGVLVVMSADESDLAMAQRVEGEVRRRRGLRRVAR